MQQTKNGISSRSYLAGFVLCLALTAIAFGAVGTQWPSAIVIPIVFGAAAAQILAQLYFFLHLDTSPTHRWNLAAALFTLSIIVLFAGGTVWILYNLRDRMM